MKKIFIFIPLILSGCAKVSTYQDKCDLQYKKMSEIADCLERNVNSDLRMSSSSNVKLYVLAAKSLGNDVDVGKITETQARLELKKLYFSLQRNENDAFNNVIYNTHQNSQQASPVKVDTSTTCSQSIGIGNTVSCSSSGTIK